MKRILLISDTHGYLDDQILSHVAQADEVWHAGDIGNSELVTRIASLKPFRAVWGNIDDASARKQFQENLVFECEEVKVLITHIGGYPGHYPARIKNLLVQYKPGLFICGHSHILKVMPDKELNLLHINPGACGVHGFHHMRTAVRFTIDGKNIRDLAVIEFGLRAKLPEIR